jgi:hypothetical protein
MCHVLYVVAVTGVSPFNSLHGIAKTAEGSGTGEPYNSLSMPGLKGESRGGIYIECSDENS